MYAMTVWGKRIFIYSLILFAILSVAGGLALRAQADQAQSNTPVYIRCDAKGRAYASAMSSDGKLFGVRVPDFDKAACNSRGR